MLAFDPYDVPDDEDRAARAELVEEAVAVWDRGPDTVISSSLALARRWGRRLPVPGGGRTRHLWQSLADVAAVDLTVARTLEPHLDAAAILDQAGADLLGEGTWGVFAAEGPAGRLTARQQTDGWLLHGTKPWCSLAGRLDSALVTAWTGDTTRRLFAVDLTGPGVRASGDPWVPHGLSLVTSTAIHLDGVAATPVGDDGWYLRRPGFAWGGIGVAACWWGGTVGLVRRLRRQAEQRELDQVGQLHLGAADAAVHAAGAVLAAAAAAVDRGTADGAAGDALALRVRQTVRRAAEEVLTRCAHALGPAPLATEAEHVRRVSDLTLYLRQEHAERDQAALGRAVLQPSSSSTRASWSRDTQDGLGPNG